MKCFNSDPVLCLLGNTLILGSVFKLELCISRLLIRDFIMDLYKWESSLDREGNLAYVNKVEGQTWNTRYYILFCLDFKENFTGHEVRQRKGQETCQCLTVFGCCNMWRINECIYHQKGEDIFFIQSVCDLWESVTPDIRDIFSIQSVFDLWVYFTPNVSKYFVFTVCVICQCI